MCQLINLYPSVRLLSHIIYLDEWRKEMASKYNWEEIDWKNMNDDLDRIVALSRYYGSDPDFVLAGGGNTSVKMGDTLYIKTSGISLADMTRDGFVALSREKVSKILVENYSKDHLLREEQVKDKLLEARIDKESGRPSVETMLHESIKYKFVVHTHPCLINGLTCAKNGKDITKELFGDKALWIDYTDPGYTLAKKVQTALVQYRASHKTDPEIILIQNHGVFVSADDTKTIKAISDQIVEKISGYASKKEYKSAFGIREQRFQAIVNDSKIKELSPALRAIFTVDGKYPVVVYDRSSAVMEFVSSEKGEELARSGSFTPDQIVYCKRSPLWVSVKSADEKVEDIVKRTKDSAKKFSDKYGYSPRVVLIQGIGMFCIGDSKRNADNSAIIYEDAVKIMKYSSPYGGPHFMNDRQSKFIDEWEVENYRRKIASGSGAMGRVAGKIAVVTGAAQGFGEGIARSLASQGAYVVVADLNLKGAQNVACSLNEQYGVGRAFAVKVDVTDEVSMSSMISEVVREYGGIDVFISNAGVVKSGSVKTLELKDFEFVTKVNYVGYFIAVKHTSPVMANQHKYDPSYMSDIIQINSKSGLQGSNKNAAYAGSKFGGIGLTQSFALELVEDGIKINSICPGNFLDGPLWSDPEKGLFVQYLKAGKVPGAKTIADVRCSYESKVPMGRGCRTEDVMHTIYYLIDQPYETGQAITVTGGQLMR
jgi:rhamnose utilization protein RhaD (predicted bifunctional aldolase and dehydrogenase)/NAD(P)-dependent dehydrogenase (short-subunit alcohol dehydrogenase family)